MRLVGVGATNLVASEGGQLALFEPAPAARRVRLNRALDALADRFGARAVLRGGVAAPERAGLSLQRKIGVAAGDEEELE